MPECIAITTEFNVPDEIHFLIKELLHAGKRIQLAKYSNGEVVYEFTNPANSEERTDFVKDYEALFSNALMTQNFFKRFVIPCSSKYKKIVVTYTRDFIPADYILSILWNDFPKGYNIPYMISPYVVKRSKGAARALELESLEEVKEFAYENRADENVTKEEISNLYDEFVKETKDAVKTANEKYPY